MNFYSLISTYIGLKIIDLKSLIDITVLYKPTALTSTILVGVLK